MLNEKNVWSEIKQLCLKYHLKEVFSQKTTTQIIKYKEQHEQIDLIQFEEGGFYLGVVRAGLSNGLGIFRYSDGKFDSGIYKNGVQNGLGRKNFSNGDVYDGFFSEGQFTGEGIFYQ